MPKLVPVDYDPFAAQPQATAPPAPSAVPQAGAPIDIRAPDGSIVRFPAGMADADIEAVMRQHYPAPKLVPVDHDPFAAAPLAPARAAAAGATPKLVPVDYDPFAAPSGGNSIASAATSTLRAMNEAIPFSDRIEAGLHSLPVVGNGQTYADNLAQERAQRAQLNQQHPLATALARAAGGAALMVVPGAVPGAAVPGGGLVEALASGMKIGGAYGTAQGVSDTPDLTNPGNAAANAVAGGVKGAGLGSVFAGLGYGAGRLGSNIADRFSSPLPVINGSKSATSALADAYSRDRGAVPDIPDFGAQGMVLDTGPAMTGLAKSVAPTRAGAALKAAIADRAAGVGSGIADALPDTLGPDQSALSAAQSIQAQRTIEGQKLPDVFAGAPPVDTGNVLASIDRRMAAMAPGSPEQLAMARARTMLTGAPAQPGIPATRIPILGPQGQVIRYQTDSGLRPTEAAPVNDAQTLNSAKKALADMVNFGDPSLGIAPGALASKENAINQTRAALNDALKTQVPGYGDVMDEMAALAKQNEAVQFGRDLLDAGKNAVNPADSAAALAGMSPAELDAAKTGLIADVFRRIGTAPAPLKGLNALLPGDTQFNARKLGQLLSPDQMNGLRDLQARSNQFQNVGDMLSGVPSPAGSASVFTPADTAHVAIGGATGLPIRALSAVARAAARAVSARQFNNPAVASALAAPSEPAMNTLGNVLAGLAARKAAAQGMGSDGARLAVGAGLGMFDH